VKRRVALAFAGLLMLCLAPDAPAQTAEKKHRDSTSTTSQGEKAKILPQKAQEEDDEERDSTATPTKSMKHARAGKKTTRLDDEGESDTAWELEAKIDYDTWRIRRGVDQAGGIPALTPAAILTHESGLSMELNAMCKLSERYAFTLWSMTLGYEHEFADWATGSLQYARYGYNDSGENSVAGKFDSWTLMGNFDARVCEIDFTADLYPGEPSILYVTIDLSKAFEVGDFTITPAFEACYLIEKLHVEFPRPLPSTDLHIHGFSTISLQCEIDWQATDRLALSVNQQFTRFPLIEITSKIRGFSTTLTVSYTFDF
jgi:hypothetical protein